MLHNYKPLEGKQSTVDPRILEAIGGGDDPTPVKLATGVYQCTHWNGDAYFRRAPDYCEDDYPIIVTDDQKHFPHYGVCDDPAQLMKMLPWHVTGSADRFCIMMVKLEKKSQPEQGGWRWHKWGEYVGQQVPLREYLADEPDIEEVWTFHIYRLRQDEFTWEQTVVEHGD